MGELLPCMIGMATVTLPGVLEEATVVVNYKKSMSRYYLVRHETQSSLKFSNFSFQLQFYIYFFIHVFILS